MSQTDTPTDLSAPPGGDARDNPRRLALLQAITEAPTEAIARISDPQALQSGIAYALERPASDTRSTR